MYAQTAVNESGLALETVEESLIQENQLSIANQNVTSGHVIAMSSSHVTAVSHPEDATQPTGQSTLVLQAGSQTLEGTSQLQTEHTEMEST